MTWYSAPYGERRSRSIARNTSESSSTLSKVVHTQQEWLGRVECLLHVLSFTSFRKP